MNLFETFVFWLMVVGFATMLIASTLTHKVDPLKVMLLHNDIKPPSSALARSAGYDIYLPHPITILPGQRMNIKLGFCTEIPRCYTPGKVHAACIFARSKWGAKGIIRLAGLIDEDYRDEWILVILNTSNETMSFDKHERIAQFTIEEVVKPTVETVEKLNRTERLGGFGSTGK